MDIKIDADAVHEIAIRSRFTPRTANYHLKRCRDYAQINKTDLTRDVVEKALNMLGENDTCIRYDETRDVLNIENSGDIVITLASKDFKDTAAALIPPP